MNTLSPTSLLEKATAHLDFANEEMNRPAEDLVTFSVCYQTKQGLSDLMHYHLLQNKIEVTGHPTLEELRQKCATFDRRFEMMNFESMRCYPTRLENEDCFCLGIDRVKECLSIANQVKTLIESKI
jgi:hypothetical protein